MSKVTVIISEINSERTIKKCLDCLFENYIEPFEVIVVDGGSTDNTLNILQEYERNESRLFIVDRQRVSESEGQNIGLLLCRTEIVFFTNSDIYVPKDWILWHLLRHGQGYELVGGSVLWAGDKYSFLWNSRKENKVQFIQTLGLGLGFSNCSTTMTAIKKAGGLKNLSSQQDTVFSFDLVRRQMKMILDPRIMVIHDHPFKSYFGSLKRAFGYARNHTLVIRAVYGKLVYGKGYPFFPFKIFQRLNLAKGYYDQIENKQALQIKQNIFEFLFFRFIYQFAQLYGIIVGALIRNPSLEKLGNLHTKTWSGNNDSIN